MVVVIGILGDCVIAFVNPAVSPLLWFAPGLSRCCLDVVRLVASFGFDCMTVCPSVAVCGSVCPDSCLSAGLSP